MKIIVIGATGTIGGAVAEALEAGHEVVRVSGGSITLISGRFAEPVPGSSLGHLANAGLEEPTAGHSP